MLLTDKNLGKRIAYLRKRRKLSQVKLAAIIGTPFRHLSDIETGRRVPRIQILAQLAVALGVSINELNGHS